MTKSFFVKLELPLGLNAEAREAFSVLLPRLASRLSFQGLEDWQVDVKNSRVLGAELEFLDLTRAGKLNREMRVYFALQSDAVAFAKLLRTSFEDIKVHNARRLASRDWMKLWRKHYKTQILREGKGTLAIVPAWKKAPKKGWSVRITPGQAFGTGTHPTTQLCLRLLLRYGGGVRKVLDFGAGTGVLLIAAQKISGAKGLAVESDLVALEQCRKNAKLNRCKGLSFSPKAKKGTYDLVFANVLAPVLLLHRASLHGAVAKGGMIFLSGILKTEAQKFLREFRSPAFELMEQLDQGEWSAIALRKKTGP